MESKKLKAARARLKKAQKEWELTRSRVWKRFVAADIEVKALEIKAVKTKSNCPVHTGYKFIRVYPCEPKTIALYECLQCGSQVWLNRDKVNEKGLVKQ